MVWVDFLHWTSKALEMYISEASVGLRLFAEPTGSAVCVRRSGVSTSVIDGRWKGVIVTAVGPDDALLLAGVLVVVLTRIGCRSKGFKKGCLNASDAVSLSLGFKVMTAKVKSTAAADTEGRCCTNPCRGDIEALAVDAPSTITPNRCNSRKPSFHVRDVGCPIRAKISCN